MGRGGEADFKRSLKQRGRSKDKGSDDSDEDYVVENEEIVSEDDSEDLGISLERYASEESFDCFVEHEEEEEEEEVVEKFRKVDIPKKKRCSLGDRKTRGKISQKRKRVSCEEEDDDEDGDEDYVNDDNDEDEDVDEDEDEDEEFAPDEYDCLDEDDCFGEDEDEDEEVTVRKKNKKVKLVKGRRKERGSKRYRKRRRESRVSKNPSTKKTRTKRRLRKKEKFLDDDEDCGDFVDSSPVVKQKSEKHSSVRRRKSAICSDSDSDFMPSASSECDYTISEEEKEQVKEASELCEGLKSSLRGSSSVKNIHGDEDLLQQTKSLGRKGKEKVKEVQSEVGKQVCGICLSEEDKRRLRGTLDCCSHYFCFTCIMEWSKVESRCPLCKQRFMTITKNGRSTVGLDQRSLVFEVPKRDQVYQMSEEEIRSFIDPYENVICTECHEGGDDGLMLLCDLCDSPAHTFCVGLGRQVPEGNWYCNDCIPVALGTSSTLAQDPSPDQRSTANVFIGPQHIGNSDGLDPISDSSPHMAFAQGFGNLSSPRFPNGDVQAASPVSGAGAPTLSMRRQLHRHIQNLISSSRMHPVLGRVDVFAAANMRNDSQTALGGEMFIRNSRAQEMGTSQGTFLDERIQATDHPSSSIQNRDSISLRPSQSSRQVIQDSTFRTADEAGNLTLWPEFNGNNTLAGFERLHQHSSRSNIGSDGNLSPYRVREEGQFYAVKEQLQSMVKNHLQSLSYDVELDPDTFKDIARSSTHTILAACGFEHKRSEVHVVHPPSICPHLDRVAAGQTSMMKGYCVSCFDSFVRDVVKTIKDTRMPQWLSLGL